MWGEKIIVTLITKLQRCVLLIAEARCIAEGMQQRRLQEVGRVLVLPYHSRGTTRRHEVVLIHVPDTARLQVGVALLEDALGLALAAWRGRGATEAAVGGQVLRRVVAVGQREARPLAHRGRPLAGVQAVQRRLGRLHLQGEGAVRVRSCARCFIYGLGLKGPLEWPGDVF